MGYQGEGAYAGLKVAAVISAILAGIVAVALWFGADDPRIEIDALGNPSITTDADPAVIAAGVLILGEGILLGLVFWAIGTIGNHVVALRKAAGRVEEPFTVPLPPSPLEIPSSDTRREDVDRMYDVVLHRLGSARGREVRRLIAAHTNNWFGISSLKSTDVRIAVGLSDFKAEALRADLEEAGARASVEETDRR